MIKFAICALLLSALLPSHSHAEELRMQVGGMDRMALVVNAQPSQEKRPLVLVLHGGAGSAAMQRQRTGFDAVAQREGFMVVYPQGSEFRPGMHAWNTGYLMRRQVGTVDDVAFLDALIDRLIDQYGADPKRVYMTGGSNGGMMTMVYATQRAERLAGIAPVIAAMFSFDVRPSRPIPILLINGALDQEVPIDGGMSRNPLVRNAQTAPYQSLEDTVNFWLGVNRSHREPQVHVEGSVTTRTWRASPGGAVTVSVVDAEAGHGWPGSGGPSRRGTGTSRSFSAAELIWAFFRDQRP
ncbi:MAG: alpha/beta hydrolase family esterase [Betaproteobacteria bacterium]